MRLKFFMIILLLSSSVFAMAEEAAHDSLQAKVYQGFSGGMMLHTGYLFGIDAAAPVDAAGQSFSLQGSPMGVGGAMRVHLWQLLRVGFEGYVSTLRVGLSNQSSHLQSGSYSRVGSGGINIDACWRKAKAWPYLGAALGGGNIRSLYLVDGNQDDWVREREAYFHKQSFFYVAPYVGCDYCVTQKLHLTFRIDWMLAFHRGDLMMPTGPRLYLGLMFTH